MPRSFVHSLLLVFLCGSVALAATGTLGTGTHWADPSEFAALKQIGYDFAIVTVDPNNAGQWASTLDAAQSTGIKLVIGAWPPPYSYSGTVGQGNGQWTISAAGMTFINYLKTRGNLVAALYVFNEPYWTDPLNGGATSVCGMYSAAELRALRTKIQGVWPAAKIYHDIGTPSAWAPGGSVWSSCIGNKYADQTGVADYVGIWFYPFRVNGYLKSQGLSVLSQEISFANSSMAPAKPVVLGQALACTAAQACDTTQPVWPTQADLKDWNCSVRGLNPEGMSWYVWRQTLYTDFLANHPGDWPLTTALACTSDPNRNATPLLNQNAGHINFYKHTAPSDDAYTSSPSPSTVQFMNQHFARLMTFSPYWDTRLAYYGAAWVYADSYAIYLNDPQTAQTLQQHPDWVLHDASGNNLYINFACSGGTCPQYAANITDPNGFRAHWISNVASALNRSPSYKGIWVDDVNLDLSGHVSDGNGQTVTPIDPQTGAPMTNAAWRIYFADFMEQIRAAFPKVEIVHNDIYFTNSCDPTDPQIQREIRAADFLNLERGVNDSGVTGGNGCFSYNSILAFIDNVHANGRGVVLDAENADTLDNQEYSAASYLLISTGRDLVGEDQQTPSHWWAGFDVDLGAAQAGRYVWNNLLRRDFAGGIALVNPPGGPTLTVTLPGIYRQIDGTPITTLTLASAQGAVLIQNNPSLPPPLPVALSATPSATVYPNPWRKDKHATKNITFANLPSGSTVKIFTVSGHKIAELKESGGSAAWDLKNDKGDPVASGLYMYLITDGQGNKMKGKTAVIR